MQRIRAGVTTMEAAGAWPGWLPLAAVLAILSLSPAAPGNDAAGEFFERRIRPVLAEHCYSCHSADAEKLRAGLQVDSRSALLQGGHSGPALIPGQPDKSLLVRAVEYDDPDLQMPPNSRLAPELIRDLRHWVAEGAFWPGEAGSSETPRPAARDGFNLEARKEGHWAWKPVKRPPVPATEDQGWARNPVDAFILERLEAAGLKPGPVAEREVLIRRAAFVLTGLPPEASAVSALLQDPDPDAVDRWIDELLESPHFGERWARHWLDKVRYAETLGHEFDYPILGAWRYRDYVVRAFNQDLPFDQFAREQIAGDLLPVPRFDPASGLNESRLATLQYWFPQQVHSPVDVRLHQIEFVDNQVDVVTKAFLGLTVSCARCHDHKFDAVSTRDYHALYGILSSSRYGIQPVDDPAPRRAAAEALLSLRDSLRKELARELEQLREWPEVAEGAARLREEDLPLPSEGWFCDGDALVDCGAGQPAGVTENRLRLVRTGWRDSGMLSRRFQGAARSPTFEMDRNYLHIRAGGMGSRFSVVVEGFTLIRAPIYDGLRRALKRAEPQWITVDVSMWKGRRAWIEFADYSEQDPATTLPGSAASAEGWFTIGEICLSSRAEPPPVAEVPAPSNPMAVIAQWKEAPERLTAEEVAWLGAWVEKIQPKVSEEILARWKGIEETIEEPVLTGGMVEGTGWDEHVFIRGNPKMLGELVSRQFLEGIPVGPDRHAYRTGSGRLALADAITDPENPFFSRVAVNWIWSKVFGEGLVSSVDNFGALGAAPTHPELLDWLAAEFRDRGWSVKSMIRTLMHSRVWQLSSRSTQSDAERKDPANHLLHRAHIRRLEGEALRDAILAISGRLDRTVGGPSIPIHLTPFMEGRGRPSKSGPMDGEGRRSLYLEVRRNFLSPWMLAFDMPVPATTVGRRSVSNVPSQALALMNDPFVLGEAERWARRLAESSEEASPEHRVESAYLQAFGRYPTSEEKEAALGFVLGEDGSGECEDSWVDLCHSFFHSKQFSFLE